jgi:hypothetical protein
MSRNGQVMPGFVRFLLPLIVATADPYAHLSGPAAAKPARGAALSP